jgi:DNA-binding FrmR family transcriptional regulator
MAHTERDKKKLLQRVHRIRGQVEAIERGLEAGQDCYKVLQTVAAARGALNGLMAEILEGHIRSHLLDAEMSPAERTEAADELVDVVRSFLK